MGPGLFLGALKWRKSKFLPLNCFAFLGKIDELRTAINVKMHAVQKRRQTVLKLRNALFQFHI
jgi:hypothetical protein